MDIRRTLRVVNFVLIRIENSGFESHLNDVLSQLDAWASSANLDTAKNYSDSLRNFRAVCDRAQFHDAQPLMRSIIEDLGGQLLIEKSLPDRIENLVRNSITPAEALPKANALVTEILSFVQKLRKFKAAVDNLGIVEQDICDNFAEISVIIPSDIAGKSVSDTQDILNEWNMQIGHVAEAAGDTRDSVDIIELKRGSLIFVLLATVGTARLLLAVVLKALEIYEKILDCQVKRRMMEEIGCSGPTLASIDDDINNRKEKLIEQSVQIITDDYGSEIRVGTSNGRTEPEVKICIAKSLSFVLQSIDNNIQVEIDFPQLESAADVENDADAEDGEDLSSGLGSRVSTEILANKWKSIEGKPRKVLNLASNVDNSTDDSDNTDS